MKNLKIATAVMSGRIYAGKVNKVGNAFLDGKIDVTGDCVNAVCEHAIGKGGVITLTANGLGGALLCYEARQLIARCESAEKDLAAANRIVAAMAMDLGMITELCGADENDLAVGAVRYVISQRNKAHVELKELREQKPTGEFIGEFKFENGQSYFTVKCFDSLPPVGAKMYELPVAQSQDSAEQKCDACGGHDVELLKTCHNSLCENYSTHIGIYKGWENKSAQDEVKE